MKTFYSAEDIEALAAQGVTELRLDEDTVLTHLARDMAQKLGISLVYGAPAPRAASSAVTAGSSSRPAPALGAKPRGCQHGSLAGRSSGGGGSAGSSDKTVSELIGLVRQLADKGTKS
jgi:hypothetical protein